MKQLTILIALILLCGCSGQYQRAWPGDRVISRGGIKGTIIVAECNVPIGDAWYYQILLDVDKHHQLHKYFINNKAFTDSAWWIIISHEIGSLQGDK